eukprot:SAG11_NODE_17699_length_511_cov_0.995146_1_plen_22_part_10
MNVIIRETFIDLHDNGGKNVLV